MKSKLTGILLDLIIILLCACMLWLVFMHAASAISSPEDGKPRFNDLWIIQGYDSGMLAAFDPSMCLPDAIVYKQPKSSPRAVYNDTELKKTVYGVLSNVITDVFGAQSVANRIDGDVNAFYSTVANADSYLLFDYASELPYHCIYAFSTGSNTVSYESCSHSDSFYVSDIALILDNEANESTYRCFAFDKSGNAYEFMREDGEKYILPAADRAHIEAYAEKFSKVQLAHNNKDFFDKITPDSLDILYGGFEYSLLSPAFSISGLGLDDQSTVKELLDIFDINIEKINKYNEADGTTVFIGTDDRLEISSDGHINFTNTSSPVDLKEISGFSTGSGDGYNTFDMMKSVNVIIAKLKDIYPNYFGGDASPKLTSVYKDSSGNSVFEYSYYINGVRINLTPSLRFVFTSNGLTEFVADITAYEQGAQRFATMPKSTVYNRLSLVHPLPSGSTLIPVYVKSDDMYDISWFTSKINTNNILS